ncbi:uncharacterized protein LOC124433767 isoform X2 [Xenia sp. Carnegie-2017]|nr:uncharacterized protein LOC124433767 isoform X2 [Xenia sp. Carnegie-2017]
MKEGALKRTDTGGWAHVICALYIPEVRFGNVSTMEPIILSSVPHEKFQKTCYLCEEHGRESKTSAGACMQCNKVGCRQAFHVTCAQAAKLLCEEQQGVSANTVKYVGYCSYHWNKKGKGDIVPRPNEKARSKAEGRNQPVQKPDITKRPSVIGTMKSSETPQQASSAKPKNRKPSTKASDGFVENSSGNEGASFSDPHHYMKTHKITSPLNTPSSRDHVIGFPGMVPNHFPFPHGHSKTESTGHTVNTMGIFPPKGDALAENKMHNDGWRAHPNPPSVVAVKKTDKHQETTVNGGKNSTHGETKNGSKGSTAGTISKKRKSAKSSGTDEEGKKKTKTSANHERKNSSNSFGSVGKGKMPVLPPSPFVSKSIPIVRDVEIPTKLEDFLEFQWKQGVEFLSHQPGYLDVASLLSCLHQLKHDNVKLEARLAELVKRRDHLLLVNSRLSKPFDQTSTTSGSKNSKNNEANVANNFKSPFLARTNQSGLVGKSTENAVSAVDVSKADKHDEFSKQPDPSVAQKQNEVGAAKKEHQRQKQFSENSSSIKENHQQHQQAPQQVEKRSPVKLDTPALSVDERISSPSRAGKGSGEGKNAAASNSSGAGENPPSRQSPKSRKSPQSGGGGKKSKVQEQLYQQEHQKLLQQQQHHIKQQQLNRQKFQPAHLLPLKQANQQFGQHFAHQNSQLAFFKLPGYNGSEQHAMHQSKPGQITSSPQQFNGQPLPRQFPNFVPYIEPAGIHNVRMQGYMPLYPVENPLNKAVEEKIESSGAAMEKTDRRN